MSVVLLLEVVVVKTVVEVLVVRPWVPDGDVEGNEGVGGRDDTKGADGVGAFSDHLWWPMNERGCVGQHLNSVGGSK